MNHNTVKMEVKILFFVCLSHFTAVVVSQGPLDAIIPYSYQYAVSDDEKGTSFGALETSDGSGTKEGSYNVLLADGKTQTVTYRANDEEGYVAEVSYDQVPNIIPNKAVLSEVPIP